MHDDEWCNLVKRYQAAALAFYEAVDRLTVPGASFQHSWESAERARIELAHSRTAILDHERRRFAAAAARGATPVYEAEELVLGDQGQSGG